jgi:hypothetical protein
MLGEIVSELIVWADQYGLRLGSRFNMTRCLSAHGQSNASHVGQLTIPTATTPLRGKRSGIASAAFTT